MPFPPCKEKKRIEKLDPQGRGLRNEQRHKRFLSFITLTEDVFEYTTKNKRQKLF
jgi:hypothetical protein